MINSTQADYALEQAEAARLRTARIEQQALALAYAEAESARADALAAKKSRDVVAQGLTILLSESDSPENPLSRLATQSYVDSYIDERIAFLARWLFATFRRQS
jgi:hypothetical protein